jgi:DNA-binding CsgD family transcriptional regulator
LDKSGEYGFFNDLIRFDSLDELEQPIVDFLGNAFEAQTITVIEFVKDRGPRILLSQIQDSKLDTFFSTCYAEFGYFLDPFYIVSFGEANLTAHQLREIAPDRFETSEYFARYYAKTGLIDELGASIRLGPNSAVHLSIGRLRNFGRFRSNELKYFRQIAPIIMNRLETVIGKSAVAPEIQFPPDLVSKYRNWSDDNRTGLSAREAEIAALIVQGHSSRAAGLRLGISDKTVKVHRRNIYKKLHISSRNELFLLLAPELNIPGG